MAHKVPSPSPSNVPPRPPVPPTTQAARPIPVAKPAVVVDRPPARLVSLDAFRGLIMTLLAVNGFGIWAIANRPESSDVWKLVSHEKWERFAFHFEHPDWKSNFLFGANTDPNAGSPWLRGAVSAWDLIQPSFMFMVGVAMPFSALRRRAVGESTAWRWTHAAIRALTLVLLGVFLYSLDNSRTDWIFPNVLAQIGLGYLFAYAVLNLKWWGHVAAIAVILIGTWLAFFLYQVPADYDYAAVNARADHGEVLEPPFKQWSKNGNFAHNVDTVLLNKFPRPPEEDPWKFNGGGYQTLNFVPSIATTILGILCGNVLLSLSTPWKKVGKLVGIALLCYLLGMASSVWLCPIVKRIWTPSWVLFSGGYVIGLLAFFYIFFDIFPFRKLAFPLVVVGMNSILMYLMGELIEPWVRDKVIHIHFQRIIESMLVPIGKVTGWSDKLGLKGIEAGQAIYSAFQPIIDHTAVFVVFWLIAYALYRKRILLRI
jgi:predicted acyltransferase